MRRFIYLFMLLALVWTLISLTTSREAESDSPRIFCQSTHSSSDVYLHLGYNPDGVGYISINMLFAMVYASYRGWRFGGTSNKNRPHNVDSERFFEFIFWKRECFSDEKTLSLPTLTSIERVGGIAQLEKLRHVEPGTLFEIVYADLRDAAADRANLNPFFTKPVLQDLRRLASYGVRQELDRFSYFRQCPSSSVTVVGHLRWGDFDAGERRRIRDWLFSVLTHIQQLIPNTCVHVFTSVLTHEEQTSLLLSMQHFTDAGIAVHIQVEVAATATDDLISNMAHFIDADVFVMSPSSLSVLTGLVGRGCMIYPRPMKLFPPLAHWMQVPLHLSPEAESDSLTDSLADVTSSLPLCVKSLR